MITSFGKKTYEPSKFVKQWYFNLTGITKHFFILSTHKFYVFLKNTSPKKIHLKKHWKHFFVKMSLLRKFINAIYDTKFLSL